MTNATTEQLRVIPLGQTIGAQIDGIDLAAPLDADTVAFLKDAWERHLVLRFRGQSHLSLQGQIAFSRHFANSTSAPSRQRPCTPACSSCPRRLP